MTQPARGSCHDTCSLAGFRNHAHWKLGKEKYNRQENAPIASSLLMHFQSRIVEAQPALNSTWQIETHQANEDKVPDVQFHLCTWKVEK